MSIDQYFVYILTNKGNRVLYVGMTNNLPRRVFEHKLKIRKCFTNRYNADKLVYYEIYQDLKEAAAREIRIKGWTRKKKTDLINSMNQDWIDLTLQISDDFSKDPSLRSGVK